MAVPASKRAWTRRRARAQDPLLLGERQGIPRQLPVAAGIRQLRRRLSLHHAELLLGLAVPRPAPARWPGSALRPRCSSWTPRPMYQLVRRSSKPAAWSLQLRLPVTPSRGRNWRAASVAAACRPWPSPAAGHQGELAPSPATSRAPREHGNLGHGLDVCLGAAHRKSQGPSCRCLACLGPPEPTKHPGLLQAGAHRGILGHHPGRDERLDPGHMGGHDLRGVPQQPPPSAVWAAANERTTARISWLRTSSAGRRR